MRCYACGERKPAEDFAADPSKASGRKSICRPCDKAKSGRYYKANREAKLARLAAAKEEARGGPRRCARCDQPSRSSRHMYCTPCALWAEDRRQGRKHPATSAQRRADAERRRARPDATQRGYGHRHKMKRKEVAPLVESGGAFCARCGLHIAPGEPWDLGHDDNDRTQYQGPEHRRCNRATSGRKQKRNSRKW